MDAAPRPLSVQPMMRDFLDAGAGSEAETPDEGVVTPALYGV
jgi:hypothetical protein